MSKKTTAPAPRYVFAPVDLEAVGIGADALTVAMVEIARGDRGHYVRPSGAPWGRKIAKLADDASGTVWTAAADPARRVEVSAAKCRAARRAADVVERHLPLDTDPDVAAAILRQVARVLGASIEGYGVKSPKVTGAVARLDLTYLSNVKKPTARKSDKPADKPADAPSGESTDKPADAPASESSDAPASDAPASESTVSVATPPTVTPFESALAALKAIESATPAEFDALKAALLAINVAATV